MRHEHDLAPRGAAGFELRGGIGVFVASIACASIASSNIACSSVDGAEPFGTTSQGVVYGSDDRRNYYEVFDDVATGLARRTAVAVVPERALVAVGPEVFEIAAESARETWELCAGERFAEEPAIATCSGVAIGPRHVLTAGHCFQDEQQCRASRFVFEYLRESAESAEAWPRIASRAVYGCERLLAHRPPRSEDDYALDYALVLLDRELDDSRTPAQLALGPVEERGGYLAIGFGLGVPAKLELDVAVVDARSPDSAYFLTDADAFTGSSGAGLFDAQGRLVGYATGGEADLSRTEHGCAIARVLDAPCSGCTVRGERSAYLDVAVSELCRVDPSAVSVCPNDADHDAQRAPLVAGGCAVSPRFHGQSAVFAGFALTLTLALTRALGARRRPCIGRRRRRVL